MQPLAKRLAKQGRLVLEDFLPYRLSVLTNTISAQLARQYAERFKLSIPQWRVMAVLGEQSGLSAGEVGVRTAMDKVSVSRAVAALEAQGRIVRKIDDADRRRTVLRLSAKGQRIYAEIVPIALDAEHALVRALGQGDLQKLSRLLTRLQEAANALTPTPTTRSGARS